MITVKENANLSQNEITPMMRKNDLLEADKQQQQMERIERSSPFSRWTQFNNEHTKELMTLALKYPKAQAILYFLVDQMDNYNAVVCSYTVMQEVLGCSTATIARSIKTLKDLGFIAVLKSGTSNVYAINDTIYWKSWGNNKKYSKFPAQVVLAQSEQNDFFNTKTEKIKTVTLKK